ncbi:hypothetical protein, partial [Neomoorella thermoacetica]|uniref:hypothetical protein n=1 Tax=Neomoorella thermoacetica TaxID=1525 RepID=UPI001C42F519
QGPFTLRLALPSPLFSFQRPARLTRLFYFITSRVTLSRAFFPSPLQRYCSEQYVILAFLIRPVNC